MKVITMQASDWERLIGTLGLPLVLLLAIAVAAIKFIRWCKPHAEKVIGAHVTLMTTCNSTLGKLDESRIADSKRIEDLAQHTLDPNGPCQRTVQSLKHASHAIELIGERKPDVVEHTRQMRTVLGDS